MDNEKYDKTLLESGDSRNVVDKYRYWSNEHIKQDLEKTKIPLHIAIENVTHDFNVGSIIRTANAFNVSTVQIIGTRRYNKRGAMCTEKYLSVNWHESVDSFAKWANEQQLPIIAIDNVENSKPIEEYRFPRKCVLLFGSESDGITNEIAKLAKDILFITQIGSTRSINVGAAAAIAMYAYRVQD
jgi:tRNA G18 (ribose-2'-O)-methylase SpoU